MIALIADNREAIAELCKQYGIRRLDVFGSAATGAFDPASSDVDFLVDMGEYDSTVADRYLDLASALESLLDRAIDLVTEASVWNPYFRASIDRHREAVYVARDHEAAA